ncbi:MAG: KilA-N domain-containing protein [Chroococcidiopsis sp.]
MSDLIFRNANDRAIAQRSSDGYIDATAMCKAAGKKFNDYMRLETTKDYLAALSSTSGIPDLDLIQVKHGGSDRGTWIYPQVAIDLAGWLSPDFKVLAWEWVMDWMDKGIAPSDRTHELKLQLEIEQTKLEQLRLNQSNGTPKPVPKPKVPEPTSHLTPEELSRHNQEEMERYVQKNLALSQAEQERKRQEMVAMLYRMAGGK